jgi:hypothetical protein
MLETYGRDAYPANQKGQIHFVRALMEAVTGEIKSFLEKPANG